MPPIQLDFAYGVPTGAVSRTGDRFIFSFTYRFNSPLLSQYLYQERLDKVSELENKVANLEAKRTTIQAAIREHKELFDTMEADRKQSKDKADEAIKVRKATEDLLEERRKQIRKLEDEIVELETRKVWVKERAKARETVGKSRCGPLSAGGAQHKVTAGDSLGRKKYYGDSTSGRSFTTPTRQNPRVPKGAEPPSHENRAQSVIDLLQSLKWLQERNPPIFDGESLYLEQVERRANRASPTWKKSAFSKPCRRVER